MRRIFGPWIVALATLGAAAFASPRAQGEAAAQPPNSLSRSGLGEDELPAKSDVDARLLEAKALPAEVPGRAALVETYEKVLVGFAAIQEQRDKRQELEERAARAKDEVPRLEGLVAAFEDPASPEAALNLPVGLEDEPIEELDRLVTEASLEADKLRRRSERLESELQTSSERRAAGAERRSEIEQELTNLGAAAAESDGASSPKPSNGHGVRNGCARRRSCAPLLSWRRASKCASACAARRQPWPALNRSARLRCGTPSRKR